jgi:predicted Ser/Thr protein kinase
MRWLWSSGIGRKNDRDQTEYVKNPTKYVQSIDPKLTLVDVIKNENQLVCKVRYEDKPGVLKCNWIDVLIPSSRNEVAVLQKLNSAGARGTPKLYKEYARRGLHAFVKEYIDGIGVHQTAHTPELMSGIERLTEEMASAGVTLPYDCRPDQYVIHESGQPYLIDHAECRFFEKELDIRAYNKDILRDFEKSWREKSQALAAVQRTGARKNPK